MNLTTNEMFNYKRYPYLRDKRGKYTNPFSRGPVINLFEFFFCAPDTGFGLYEEDLAIWKYRRLCDQADVQSLTNSQTALTKTI